jgi:hypothetical protein
VGGKSNGRIYNSNVNDATAWTANDFITAEREDDELSYVAKHHDHVVAMGASTMEFFYNNANPSGSPLARRTDLFYRIGVVATDAVWEAGDKIVFVGTDARGGVDVYVLENFQIRKVSTHGIGSFLTSVLIQSNISAFASGASAQGKTFYLLTVHTTPSDITSQVTLALDIDSGFWSTWTTDSGDLDGQGNVPIIGWTQSTTRAPEQGVGILANGELIHMEDALSPVDGIGVSGAYFEEEYFEGSTYFENASTNTSVAIPLGIRTGHQDLDDVRDKFCHKLQLVGDFTNESDTLNIKYSDGGNDDYGVNRAISTHRKDYLTRLGKFSRRSWDLSYTGTQQLRLEALELDVDLGEH